MVNPLRTPTISPNNLISNALTHTQQFQEEFYQKKVLLVAAGGVIEQSSSGAAAGAGDNIPNAAAVGTGLAGVGAWFLIRFDNIGGNTVRFLWMVNDNAAPIQAIQHRGGNATWNLDGTTSALPTIATGFAYTAVSIAAFLPFTDVRSLRWSSWRTTTPVAGALNIRFLLKEEGAAISASTTHYTMEIFGNTDASGGGIGLNRWGIFTTTGGMTIANYQSASNWRGVTISGNATADPTIQSGLWDLSSSWTNGLDTGNRENLQSPLVGVNLAAGRLLGILVDSFAIPAGSTLGLWSDATETGQTYRRKNFGAIAYFWPDTVDLL